MRKILLYLLDSVLSSVRSRAAIELEIIALRHQLEVLQRTRPARFRLTRLDRIIWLLLYRLWQGDDLELKRGAASHAAENAIEEIKQDLSQGPTLRQVTAKD